MNRRSFLKILGAGSAAIVLPIGLNNLFTYVTKNRYKPELLQELFGDLLNKLTPEEFKYLDSLNWEYVVYRVNDKGIFRVTNDLTRRMNYKDWGKGKKIDIIYKSTNVFEATIQQYLKNKELGIKTARNFDSPYFWNVIRSYRAKDEKAIAKMKQSLTGRTVKPESVAKTHATRKRKGNTGGGENQKIAAREAQLKRTKKERQEAWKKVDPVQRYNNYKDKEAHRQKSIKNQEGKRRPLAAFKDGIKVGEYESIMQASRTLNLNSGSVYLVADPNRTNYKSTKGYTFEFI